MNSCATLKTTEQANSFDVDYYDIDAGIRSVRLVTFNSYGQEEYYENIRRLLKESYSEGFGIYYENIDTSKVTDVEWRKLRRIFGVVPSDENYRKSLGLALKLGYVYYPIEEVIDEAGIEDRPLNYKPSGFIDAYEKTYGKIELSELDYRRPLEKKAPQKLPFKNTSDVLRQYRKNQFWDMMVDTLSQRKLVLLDSKIQMLFGNDVDNFEKLQADIIKKTTQGDTSYIQPEKAQSLRAIKNEHIIQDGFIDDMSDFASFKTAYFVNNELFDINYNGTRYMLMPNSNSQLKFSVNYKALSLAMSWRPRFFDSNNDVEEKGKTQGFDFDFNIIKPYWFQDIRWRFIKGFYLENTGDVDTEWQEGDPYIQEPDYLYTSLEGVTGVKFNPHFSLKALSSQVERQLHSCGSFIGTLGYRYYEIRDDNQPYLVDSISESYNFELSFNLGYYHTFVLPKNFYFSLGLSTGFGRVGSKLTVIENNEPKRTSYSQVMFNINGRATLGFNGERVFGGIYSEFKGGAFLRETPIVNTSYRGIFQLYIGYRFEAPRILRSSKLNT